MRKITTYILALFSVLAVFSSCKKEYESIESIDEAKIKEYIQVNNLQNVVHDESGLYYQIISDGTGASLKNTDSVLYNFDIKSLTGRVYLAANTNGNYANYVGYVTNPFLFRSIMTKLKGAKVKVLIPSRLAFGKNGSGDIPSNEVLLSDLSIYDVASQSHLDDDRIQAFLTVNNITATKHSSGVYYQVLTQGTGTDVIDELHSTIVTKYTGRLLDGTQFDSNDSFSTNLSQVVVGWEKVIPLFTSGAKIRIFVPSALAYGASGEVRYLKNAPLDFTIEIISVTND